MTRTPDPRVSSAEEGVGKVPVDDNVGSSGEVTGLEGASEALSSFVLVEDDGSALDGPLWACLFLSPSSFDCGAVFFDGGAVFNFLVAKTGTAMDSLRPVAFRDALVDRRDEEKSGTGAGSLWKMGFFSSLATEDVEVAKGGKFSGKSSGLGVRPLPAFPLLLPRRGFVGIFLSTLQSLLPKKQTDTGLQGRNQTGSLNLQAGSLIVGFQSKPRTLTKISCRPLA